MVLVGDGFLHNGSARWVRSTFAQMLEGERCRSWSLTECVLAVLRRRHSTVDTHTGEKVVIECMNLFMFHVVSLLAISGASVTLLLSSAVLGTAG